MSRPGRWLNCAYRRTSCGKKMSAFESSWWPTGPSDSKSLLAPFLLPVPARAKRQLYQTISTSRQMTSYPLVVSPSRAVHHPLAGPVGPSVLQGIGCGDNPAKTDNHPCPLNNMYPTQPWASQGQFQPYTFFSGSPLSLKWSSRPPFEDRKTCFPLPLVSISWITIPPGGFCTAPTLPIGRVGCCLGPHFIMGSFLK